MNPACRKDHFCALCGFQLPAAGEQSRSRLPPTAAGCVSARVSCLSCYSFSAKQRSFWASIAMNTFVYSLPGNTPKCNLLLAACTHLFGFIGYNCSWYNMSNSSVTDSDSAAHCSKISTRRGACIAGRFSKEQSYIEGKSLVSHSIALEN